MPIPSLSSHPPALFPTYLVPSLSFRRRKSSTDSNISSLSDSSNTSTTSSITAPTSPPTFLSGHNSHLRCARCLSDLALSSQIISKGFTGRHGRAYLVAPSDTSQSISPSPFTMSTTKAKNDALPNLPNTYTHRPVPRQLVTGAHTVGDISCAQCGSVLGWKYIAAEEEGQKYKVGKFILETKRVCRSSEWESEDGGMLLDGCRAGKGRRRVSGMGLPPSELPVVAEDEVEFDSQDEEECEAMFAGTWTPQVAVKRRKARARWE